MNIIEILDKRAKETPDKPAVIFREQTVSFFRLSDSSSRLAASLKGLGVNKGDKVALYLPSWPEYIFSYLAIWRIGATAVPLDFMLTEDELVSCLEHAEVKILIAKPKANLSLEALRKRCPALKEIIACQDKIDGCLFFDECVEKNPAAGLKAQIEDKDCAIIFYTSGTTGRPKGVLINYLQLGAPPKSMEFFVNSDLSEKDTTLCALPFSHLGGLIYIQNTVVFGLRLVLMERFIPSEFLKNIQNHRVNFFWIVPSMYYALLQLKEFETFDLSSLRWIVTFGASSSPEALRRFQRYCPKAHLLNGWGLTETNAPSVVLPMGSKKLESVGRPAPWIEVKIFDDQAQEVKPGAIGEICVKSWVVTDGYYKDAALTRQALKGGWFHTGDLGKFDNEGDLYIVGRKKEMIKVAGEIVFEPEIEAVIHTHPDVAEVAVVGVADQMRGEVPKAWVVLKEGKALREEDLRYFLREHLAHFKIPHYFEFKDMLPKNRAGKIDKERLRTRPI
ncbi:MAG: class I adenylate-forming enzyme family protein [Candidatus Omnitrophica bacterium]|nr:class I adenylate-forming enzyme family protein [Candidatus Omnitrophota bacterium]MDD5661659.1 class I adenylate-forming enzyme family protein [Candidatus Omnitrophota bacterium]